MRIDHNDDVKYYFLNDLFLQTLPVIRGKENFIHESRTGIIPGLQHLYAEKTIRPMKGFIPPIGMLMAWLSSLNRIDKTHEGILCYSGKELIDEYLMNTFAARWKSETKQLIAVKQDISKFLMSYTFSHYAGFVINKDFDPITTVHTVVKNFIRSINADDNKLLLFLGRDAWWFYVIARRFSIQSSYSSIMSRLVSRTQKGVSVINEIITRDNKRRKPKDCVFVDTGFAGSIMTNLSSLCQELSSIEVKLMSANGNHISKMPFPRLTVSRNIALALEYFPKINKTAKVGVQGEVIQNMNHVPIDNVMWYLISVWFYLAETPNFIERSDLQKTASINC